jgi:hypothetical protein
MPSPFLVVWIVGHFWLLPPSSKIGFCRLSHSSLGETVRYLQALFRAFRSDSAQECRGRENVRGATTASDSACWVRTGRCQTPQSRRDSPKLAFRKEDQNLRSTDTSFIPERRIEYLTTSCVTLYQIDVLKAICALSRHINLNDFLISRDEIRFSLHLSSQRTTAIAQPSK